MKLINEELFSGSLDGKSIRLLTLRNKNGMVVQVTNYGAIIVSIFAPDRKGVFSDIVQGYDSIDEYIKGNGPYMGAICGRCANRIGRGSFSIGGNEYTLAVNNGPNHLHGGIKGFNKVVWNIVNSSSSSVELEYLSPDGEEGYPGNLLTTVVYTLTEENELRTDLLARTDKSTVVNLAGHSYFNLSGEGTGSIYDHLLQINSDFFTPCDESSLPTGEILSVKDTPMDFRSPKPIGSDIEKDFEQLRFGAGYDHNWVLRNRTGNLGLAATVNDPVSGRTLEVFTTQPGLQLYTANWIDGEKGKGGKKYGRRWSFCLETQHFPDSVNKAHFPSAILIPGEFYKHTFIYKFKTN
jgi:aldose 1-epimerase